MVQRLDDYAEFISGNSPLGSVREMVRTVPFSREEETVAYLRSAPTVVDVMERLPDVVDGREVIETGSLQTDGRWYWREDLAHYVETHHLILRQEFMEYLEARDYAVVDLTEHEIRDAAQAVVADWSS